MKNLFKTSILVTLMSFVCFNLNAQQVETKTTRFGEIVNVKKPKNDSLFIRDAKIFARIGLGGNFLLEKKDNDKKFDVSSVAGGWNATALVGYQYTQKISFGAGLDFYAQFANYTQKYYAYDSDKQLSENHITSLSVKSLPIFLTARVYLNESYRPFFADVKLGYMIGLNSVITDCQRTFTEVGHAYSEGTGDDSWHGVYDEWDQYDTYSKMQGIYFVGAVGKSFNNFDVEVEFSPITWKQEFEKVYHKEFRQGELPDWEYAQTLGQHNETNLLRSDSKKKTYLNVGLKIAYNIPIKKAK
ncbi:MAG: hypothetical protein MJZ85_06995 [Bacteroidales bacterium]|nr:hypothetical protein [Bacteroidales bacterium]